jgi:glycosyltransferase 2 family protein
MGISRSNSFILKLIVSIALLFFIFRFIGVENALVELKNVDMPFIFLALIFVVFEVFFKSVRWNTVVKVFNKGLGVVSAINYTLISRAFGIVTPGRIGEFIKAKYLKDKTNISYLSSVMTVVIDKLFDIIVLVLFGLIGLSLFWEIFVEFNYFIFAFVVYALVLILVFVFFDKVIKLLPKKFKNNLKGLKIDRIFYFKSMFLSMVIWLILGIEAFLILKALGVSVSFFLIIIVVPLMALSSLLPISIGGIGVREVVAIFFFSFIGIEAEKSTVFSLLYMFISFGISAIVGAALYIKKKDIPRKLGSYS